MQKRDASRRLIAGSAIIGSIGTFGLHVLLPALPAIAEAMRVPAAAAQLLISLSLLAIALGNLAIAPLSDRFGRRPVVLASLGLFVVASLAGIVAPSLEWLVVARVLQAFGGAAAMSVMRLPDTPPRAPLPEAVGTITWYGRNYGNFHCGKGPPREVRALKGGNIAYRRKAIGALRFDERLLGSGTPMCAGCGGLEAIRQAYDLLGGRTVFVNAAGCMTLLSIYPFTPFRGSWLYTAMSAAPAASQGVRDALDILIAKGRLPPEEDLGVIALSGDGAAYGMGLSATSSDIERGLDFLSGVIAPMKSPSRAPLSGSMTPYKG